MATEILKTFTSKNGTNLKKREQKFFEKKNNSVVFYCEIFDLSNKFELQTCKTSINQDMHFYKLNIKATIKNGCLLINNQKFYAGIEIF